MRQHGNIKMKQPGERYGDVVARLLQEQKKNDYLSYLKSLAKDGDFVNLDTDEEYNQIRKKVAVTADRDWKKGSELYKQPSRKR